MITAGQLQPDSVMSQPKCLVISLSDSKTDWDIFQKSVLWWPERWCIWRRPQKSRHCSSHFVWIWKVFLLNWGETGRKETKCRAIFFARIVVTFFSPSGKWIGYYLGLCVSLPQLCCVLSVSLWQCYIWKHKDWILSWQNIKGKKYISQIPKWCLAAPLFSVFPLWKYNCFLSGSFWK